VRNIGFTLGYWIDGRVRGALLLVQEEDWERARQADGRIRDGAQVAEITDLVNLDAWPDGHPADRAPRTPPPGAQLSLFDTIEGLRHTAFITDTPRDDLAALDLRHRRRGRAEQIIRDTKACGLARLPFDSAANNDRWMQLTFAPRTCCAGPGASASPALCDGPPPRPSATGSYTSPPAPAPPPPPRHHLALDPRPPRRHRPPQDPTPAATTHRANPASHPPRTLTRHGQSWLVSQTFCQGPQVGCRGGWRS
jgi:hypothetical protein